MYITICIITIPISSILKLISEIKSECFCNIIKFIDRLLRIKFIWFYIFCFILCIWVIYWLAYYPGIVDIDNTFNYLMFLENKFTTHHPILHVLTISFFFDLGSNIFQDRNIAVGLFIVFQLIICSCLQVLAYRYLYKKSKISSLTIIIMIVLYSGILIPIIPMNMITSTKDAFFSTFFLLFIILNYELLENPKLFINSKGKIITFIIIGFLTLSLRNNFFYAYLVFTLFIILTLTYKKVLSAIPLVITIFLLFITFNSYLINKFKIEDVSGIKEMSSVPLQQLARVYNRNFNSYSLSEIELLQKIVGHQDLIQYNPYWSDFVKRYANQNVYLENKDDFINLYLSIFKKNPSIYLDSLLENTLFSWYPFANFEPRYTLYDRGIKQADSSFIFITDVNYPGTLDSKIPKLHNFLETLSFSGIIQKIPIYHLLFSIGFMFWIYLYSMILSIYRRDRAIFTTGILVLLYIGTLWLGPVMFIRYFLFLWLLLPIMLNYIQAKK